MNPKYTKEGTEEKQQNKRRPTEVAGEGRLCVQARRRSQVIGEGGKRTEANPRRAGCTLKIESKPKPQRRTWGSDPVKGFGASVQYEEANRNKKSKRPEARCRRLMVVHPRYQSNHTFGRTEGSHRGLVGVRRHKDHPKYRPNRTTQT